MEFYGYGHTHCHVEAKRDILHSPVLKQDFSLTLEMTAMVHILASAKFVLFADFLIHCLVHHGVKNTVSPTPCKTTLI
jgi:hypothetical protein